MALYMAFDTETGGLEYETSDLLTFYAGIFTEDFQLLDEVDLKLKPDDGRLPIAEAGALKVNKIDLQKHMADVNTVTYREGAIKLTEMLKRHLKRSGKYSNLVPMAYNINFDIGYSQKYLISEKEWNSILHYEKIDPKNTVGDMKRAGWIPKEIGTLTSAVEFFGVPKRNAHNAKEDTLMMVDTYKKMLELMRSKNSGGGSGGQDLISLLEQE